MLHELKYANSKVVTANKNDSKQIKGAATAAAKKMITIPLFSLVVVQSIQFICLLEFAQHFVFS